MVRWNSKTVLTVPGRENLSILVDIGDWRGLWCPRYHTTSRLVSAPGAMLQRFSGKGAFPSGANSFSSSPRGSLRSPMKFIVRDRPRAWTIYSVSVCLCVCLCVWVSLSQGWLLHPYLENTRTFDDISDTLTEAIISNCPYIKHINHLTCTEYNQWYVTWGLY